MQEAAGAWAARLEHSLVFAALFVVSGALLPHLAGEGPESPSAGGNPLLRNVTILVSAASLLLCLARARQWYRASLHAKAILALAALAVISALWSAAPEVTLRRGLVVAAYSALGIFLAARFTPAMFVRILGAVMGFSALLSLLLALALPRYGVASVIHVGAWQGVYTQKNTLGIMMVVATLALLLLWKQAERRRWLPALGAALCVALLVRSTSKTSLVILVTIVALLPLFSLLRSRSARAHAVLVLALLAAGVFGTGALVNSEAVLNALGRDVTLTGRTELWSSVVEVGARHPWLGYGYSAFWGGLEAPSLAVWREVGWQPPNSHNGLLDLWLDLGVLGAALFAASLLAGGVRAVHLARSSSEPAALWPLGYLFVFVLFNLTEGGILSSDLLWVLYVAAVTSAGAYSRPERVVATDLRVATHPVRDSPVSGHLSLYPARNGVNG